MTVPNAVDSARYVATGSDATYQFTYRIFAAADLLVQVQGTTGTVSTLILNTDYTVTGVGDYGGGSITLIAGNLTINYVILILRDPALVQDISLQTQGAYNPTAVESGLDYLTMIAQDQQTQLDKSIHGPLTDSPTISMQLPAAALRASKFAAFDSSGAAIASAGSTSANVPVETLDQVVNSLAALKALPVPAAAVTYLMTGYYTAGDGGGGQFQWNAASTAADDGGTIIQANAGGVGRWIRLYIGNDFNVQWFGAKGDNGHDDTTAIRAAVTAATAAYFNWGPPTSSTSVGVYLPVTRTGIYNINGTITITVPLNFYGDGYEVVALLQESTTAATITIAVTQSLTYKWPVIRDFSIYSGVTGTATQHGVVLTSPAATDAMVRVQRLNIIGLGGHGYHAAQNGNSCFITECRIMQCLAGIYLGGTFQTDQFIDHNIIRLNNVGIDINPDGGSFITTVRIQNNLIESNTGGTGACSSVTRPCIGIRANHAQQLTIETNYFENNANDIVFTTDVSYCLIRGNWMFPQNACNLPGTFTGPPLRRLGAIAMEGINCTYNTVIENFILGYPLQPGGTTNADWGTGTFGATYEQITDTVGITRYINNNTNLPTLGGVTITNPNNRHTIVNYVADPADTGVNRAVETKLIWAADWTYGNGTFRETRSAQQRRTFVNSFPLVDGYDFGTNSPTAFVNVNCKNGSAVDTTALQYSPFGLSALSWVANGAASPKFSWTYAVAAPVAGAHLVGDIVWNSSPVSGGFVGFICTGAGSPGTWKTFGAIS